MSVKPITSAGTMDFKVLLGSGKEHCGKTIDVCGWISSFRKQSKCSFISMKDGTTAQNFQVIVNYTPEEKAQYAGTISRLTKDAALCVRGGTIVESPAKGQEIEMVATLAQLEIVGDVDVAAYPLSKKKHSMEFVRQFPHMRGRTNVGSLMLRARDTCSFATHSFFKGRGFIYFHTPVITSNDCEGAGEMLTVTTTHPASNPKADIVRADLFSHKNDFYKKPAFLTVSGQLHGEWGAGCHKKIYTFGPTFRAEESHTSRHLSEFWMIEPEVSFISFDELKRLAADYTIHCIKSYLDECQDLLEFVDRHVSPGRSELLREIVKRGFKELSYTEAIQILQDDYKEDCGYEKVEDWGIDLNSDQEKYLTKKLGPLIVYDYPKAIKSFYMKANPVDESGRETVQAMDMLVPGIGELIGGSMRIDDYATLEAAMKAKGMNQQTLQWYLDLRRFGNAPHGGFGLGFERLIMLVTGLANIKDCIPFPRFTGHCEF